MSKKDNSMTHIKVDKEVQLSNEFVQQYNPDL